jgi:hypothetical protein
MLTEVDLRRCLFAVIELRAAMQRGQFVGVSWADEMIAKLTTELARARQSRDGDLPPSDDEDWLTSREASAILGWPLRTVQRHADKLGAISNGGRYFFLASAIREHVEGISA